MGYTIDIQGITNLKKTNPTREQRLLLKNQDRNLSLVSEFECPQAYESGIHISDLRTDTIYVKTEATETQTFTFSGSWGCGTFEEFLHWLQTIASEQGLKWTVEIYPSIIQILNFETIQDYFQQFQDIYNTLELNTEDKFHRFLIEIIPCFELVVKEGNGYVYIEWS